MTFPPTGQVLRGRPPQMKNCFLKATPTYPVATYMITDENDDVLVHLFFVNINSEH